MKIAIENYESMTPEEKLAALEAYDPEANGYVPKAVLDRASSEAASYKKQLREKQSDEEAKAQKEAEEKAALIARVEELEREKAVGSYTTAYLAMGYDEKAARASAEALFKGDTATVFSLQRTHFEGREKALRAELLKETPRPEGGSPDSVMSKGDFDKLSLIEKQRFATEHPEQYASFYKN